MVFISILLKLLKLNPLCLSSLCPYKQSSWVKFKLYYRRLLTDALSFLHRNLLPLFLVINTLSEVRRLIFLLFLDFLWMRILKHQLVPVRRQRSFKDFLKFRQNLLLFLSLLLLNLINFLSHLLQFPLLLLYQLLEGWLILHLHLSCQRIYRLYPFFLLFHVV